MRVLIANHHLAERAGSELYTQELSTALAGRGHTVAMYTFVAGAIAAELRSSGIPEGSPHSTPRRSGSPSIDGCNPHVASGGSRGRSVADAPAAIDLDLLLPDAGGLGAPTGAPFGDA